MRPFRRFTYVTAQSPTLPSHHLHHKSFFNPSVASPMSYALHLRHLESRPCHSPTLPLLYLRHSSFSNPTVALPTSQLFLQPYRRCTYVTAHSPILPLLYLRHSSFSNPSFASTSQALHIRHLASRPWLMPLTILFFAFPFDNTIKAEFQ